MDVCDHAADYQQRMNQAALANRTQVSQASLTHCKDCGDEIPKARQQIGNVKRCVECQEDFERLKGITR